MHEWFTHQSSGFFSFYPMFKHGWKNQFIMKFVLSNILSNLVCQVDTSKSLIICFVLGTLLIFNNRRMHLFVYQCQGQAI